MLPAIVSAQVIFITAMVNIICLLLIVFSCRCINSWKMTGGLAGHHWFKRFFRWHCYIWYIFLPSVIVHAVLALTLFGVPF